MLLKLLPLPIKKFALAALPKFAFATVRLPIILTTLPFNAPLMLRLVNMPMLVIFD